MNSGSSSSTTCQPWPRWWRVLLIAIATVILCSCRAAYQGAAGPGYPAVSAPALPQEAFDGVAYSAPPVYPAQPYAISAPCPCPCEMTAMAPAGSPAAPGSDPWPYDEYLCDGGDAVPTAVVNREWEIRGLDVQDTIGHFDTLDGRRVVAASNRLCIYSPRFNSVRQVVSLRQNEQRDPWAGVHQPVRLAGQQDVAIAASSKQHLQAEAEIGQRLPVLFESRQGDGAVSSVNGPVAFQDKLLPFEAPLAIGHGVLDESEMAWLAGATAAAITWSGSQPVQVFIDRERAAEEVRDERVGTVYTVRQRERHPRLRVIKIASTQLASPGETIDFTLRFDNVGDELIGNVTIVDSLTTRLEYVPGSAQCSLPGEFFTEPNEADSLVLRWEITDPLEPGQGGIIRFRCVVR